jgi:hypothetical protein
MKKYLPDLTKIALAAVLGTMISCVALKPYERVFVDDPEMQMAPDATKSFENYVHSIREGATPAGGTKGSGGCGCN